MPSALSVLPSAAASLLVVASAHGDHPSPGPGTALQDQGLIEMRPSKMQVCLQHRTGHGLALKYSS